MSGWTREDVEFVSQGEKCAGWLYRPEGVERPPIVVMCHGLGAVREMRLPAYAERFADAGLAVLAFTYRHFGDSEGEPRQLLDVGKELEDIAAALAFARELDGVDTERVALWGTSFGGGHVMVAGTRDSRVKAIVAQCPFTDGMASGMTLGPSSTLKVGARAITDLVGSLFGRRPVYAMLAGVRGEPAMMTAPDVVAGYRALLPDDFEVDNRVAARIGLKVMRYRPGRQLKAVRCPALICVCERDSVAPAKAAIRYAREAGANVELKTYPVGHFDIYLGEPFERASTDQLEFLRAKLGA